MQEAKVDDQLVQASPDSPKKAQCPSCGGTVTKRKRRRMDGGTTFFYRHDAGEGEGCPQRYTPVSADR
ncbi:MAG: hypothetical protein GY832_35375 [Chloroflexi bacterium]|nr:hypothetical protein [Chloroflexota bacterium]